MSQIQKELSTVKHDLTSVRQSEQDLKSQLTQSQNTLKQKEEEIIMQSKKIEKMEFENKKQIQQELNEVSNDIYILDIRYCNGNIMSVLKFLDMSYLLISNIKVLFMVGNNFRLGIKVSILFIGRNL